MSTTLVNAKHIQNWLTIKFNGKIDIYINKIFKIIIISEINLYVDIHVYLYINIKWVNIQILKITHIIQSQKIQFFKYVKNLNISPKTCKWPAGT